MVQESQIKTDGKEEGGSPLQLAAIVEESHDAIIGKTLEGVITSWNGGATKMFGYLPSEVIGKPMTNLFPPELKEELPRLLEKVRRGEVIADYDSIWLRKDGTRADVEFSISPVHTEAGVIIGASLVGRDITLRKKAEESMRQIQLIVENSYDAIIGETLDGVITSWNGGAVKMFGYSAHEVIGKSATFLLPPEKRDEVLVLLNKIRAGEFIADYDTVRVRKDNSMIAVALSVSPIKDEKGVVVGASIVERDITMRKRGEESLHQLQLIVEHSHDAIIGETLEGVVTSWNGGATKMFGYSSGEMVGKSMTNLFPPELKEELPRLLEKVRRGEVIADYDSIWLRKDSTRTDVEFSISPVQADVEFSLSPVHSEGGEIIGASLVGRDIVERKKSERHIKDLNEVRSKFINIISHQLRTPLTAINWNLEMVLNGDFGKLEDITKKFLLSTHKSSVEITNRIHDLLSAIDIEEGRVVYQTEEASIDSITAAIMSEMKKMSDLKGITFQYIAPGKELPAIVIDIEKIRKAINKLSENAIIYTKEKGKVTAKLEARGGSVRFEISDTGVGIPAQEQHHMFTRFFRASNAIVMQPDSFGLGLFIAQSFIKQHGGTIGFESKENEGSTFWFEIPTKPAEK